MDVDKLKLLYGLLENKARYWSKEIDGCRYFFDQHVSEIFFVPNEIYDLLRSYDDAKSDALMKLYDVNELQDIINTLEHITTFPEREIPSKCTKTRINVLTLNISNDCNLDCAYCFRDKKTLKTIEDLDLIYRAIDQMVNDFGRDAEKYVICFNLSGEPLMHWDTVKAVNSYIGKSQKTTKKDFFLFLLTNGTLLTKEIIADFKKMKNDKKISISIDGPQHVHDKARKDTRGKGSYDKIVKNIKHCKKKGLSICAEGVLTALYPKPLDIIQHYYELGFDSVLLKPVRGSTPYSFDLDSLEELKKGYREYYDFLKDELLAGNIAILRFLAKDFPIRFLAKILMKHKTDRNCFWGVSALSMNYKGDYFACDSVMDVEAYKVGSIDEGIEWDKFHSDVCVNLREACALCWAKNICGGTCHIYGIMKNNDPLAIDPVECELNKFLITESLSLVFELVHRGKPLEQIKSILLEGYLDTYQNY